jgi:serine-type D-Ala-D-Ala carboxypeptidase/endopeptidase (penicillin-binding protein 4)
MIMNILRKKSPNQWPISPRYKIRPAVRSPLPCVSPDKVTGFGRKTFLSLLLGLALVLGHSPFLSARTEISIGSILSYIQNGGYAVQISGGGVEGFNADTPFIPASTIKLLTCLAALDFLGPDYRFETRFYLDREGNLIIKGDGDPTLSSEQVSAIARELAGRGLRQITALILDGSDFALEHDVDGSEHSQRPYDAEIGPLAVNFNALPIQVHQDGRIDSGEGQTPFLPMMQTLAGTFAPGLYRVNVGAFPAEGTLANELRYTQELFTALLRKQGIKVATTVFLGRVPPKASLLLVHKSTTLKDIIRECLEYSNNFIANELFLACGRKRFGTPATWTKAQNAVQEFIHRTFHPAPGMIIMVEGSGLSRKNKLTPRMMLRVLEKFSPYADLLPIKHDLLLKSGTLKGVYCYGGYLQDRDRTAPFTIMLNQKINSRDRILRILESHFRNAGAGRTAAR